MKRVEAMASVLSLSAFQPVRNCRLIRPPRECMVKAFMKTRFVIYGQSRSGSTLLVELLDSQPNVDCDNELFNEVKEFRRRLISRLVKFCPYSYVDHKSRRCACDAYGFKFLVNQVPFPRRF